MDLEAAAGSVTIAAGDNGAGKTTLLRILATSLTPDAGEASVDGLDVVRQGAQVRERIGVALVNERSLFWRLSARRNLDLFAAHSGRAAWERRAHVAELLAEVESGAACRQARSAAQFGAAPAGGARPRARWRSGRAADRRAATRPGSHRHRSHPRAAAWPCGAGRDGADRAAPEAERLQEIADEILRLRVQVCAPSPAPAARRG